MVVCHIVCIRYTKYGNDTVFVSYGKCYSVYYDVTVCSTVCYACYHGVIKVETLSNPVSVYSCNPNPRLNPVTTS